MKNLLINGNFDIWQRGTSLSAQTGKMRLADHWEYRAIGTDMAGSREIFVPGQTDVPGEPAYFHRFVVNSVSGAANCGRMRQNIEGVRALSGQTVAGSFWAKADVYRTIAASFVQVFGDSTEVTGIGVRQFDLSPFWQKFEFSAYIPSVIGQPFPGGPNSLNHLQLIFFFDAGSNYDHMSGGLGQQSGTFDIAQVQLEHGDEPTDFEFRPLWAEMEMCRRYYQKRAFRVTTDATVVGARSNSIACGVMQRAPDVTLTQTSGSGATVAVISEDLSGPLGGKDVFVFQNSASDTDSQAVVELDAEYGSVF